MVWIDRYAVILYLIRKPPPRTHIIVVAFETLFYQTLNQLCDACFAQLSIFLNGSPVSVWVNVHYWFFLKMSVL